MISSIAKENVLPNVMIRDVLVANPQSAKSQSVLQRLDNRFDPMPEYMMNEIMQGQSVYGNKEILEQKLADHKSLRDKPFAKLIRYYQSDTNNLASSGDSLVSLLLDGDFPDARYQLAFYYLNKSDSTNTFSILNYIPTEFTLSASELTIFELYSDLLEIQWHITSDTIAMDSIQIAALHEIANHQNTIPGVYARNMLLNEGLLAYDEPVYLPTTLKVTPIWHHMADTKSSSKLNIFPNPAKTYFIVEYSMDRLYYESLLIMTDISGKHIKSFDVTCRQNQIVVPVDNLPAGIYILQLVDGRNILESKKISITR
jgi:hypothetical protein